MNQSISHELGSRVKIDKVKITPYYHGKLFLPHYYPSNFQNGDERKEWKNLG